MKVRPITRQLRTLHSISSGTMEPGEPYSNIGDFWYTTELCSVLTPVGVRGNGGGSDCEWRVHRSPDIGIDQESMPKAREFTRELAYYAGHRGHRGGVRMPRPRGGALLVAIIFALLVRKDLRLPVFAMLTVGIASHFVPDYFMWQPTGTTSLMLWPFLDVTVDYQGFYRSSDRWTAAVAISLTAVVLVMDRFVFDTMPEDNPRSTAE